MNSIKHKKSSAFWFNPQILAFHPSSRKVQSYNSLKSLPKLQEQSPEKINQIDMVVNPLKFINPYHILRLAGDIYLPVSRERYIDILGALQNTSESFGTTIKQTVLNFQNHSVEIKYESLASDIVPVNYAKERLKSLEGEEPLQTIQMLDLLSVTRFPHLETSDELLRELLDQNDSLPSIVYISTFGEHRNSKQIFNKEMIELMGVHQITLIDVVNKTQMIPTVLIDVDQIRDFNHQCTMFMKSHGKIHESSEEIYINTFENQKLLVVMKELYFSAYNKDQQTFQCIKKRTFEVKDPKAKLLNINRIARNTKQYNNEQQFSELNKKIAQEFYLQTSSEMKQKYKSFKRCGYKCKH